MEIRTLKSLDDFDAERLEYYKRIDHARQPHPNGIACPNCGNELWDSAPEMTLASNPPKKNIHCPDCKYIGYRFA